MILRFELRFVAVARLFHGDLRLPRLLRLLIHVLLRFALVTVTHVVGYGFTAILPFDFPVTVTFD